MYGAMRQRAPNSTQITGVVVTILAMAGAGYALMNGIGGRLVEALTGPMTVATLPAETPPPEDLRKQDFSDAGSEKLPWAPPLNGPTEKFVWDDRITGGEDTGGGGGTLVIAPPPIKVTNPRLLAKDKPPYPASEMRAQHQGTTGLELCISQEGRVTSAQLVSSAGFPRLDEAALKWVRGVRFAPGTLDGKPRAMCGHRIAYEWRIEGSR